MRATPYHTALGPEKTFGSPLSPGGHPRQRGHSPRNRSSAGDKIVQFVQQTDQARMTSPRPWSQ